MSDCLIDGALSLGYHVSENGDFFRRAIKEAVNAYLETTDQETGYKPQIPSFGAFLRSDIITQYPDLHIKAPILFSPKKDRAPILRQEAIGNGVLLYLFDRSPAQFTSLTFTQPLNQQTFMVGCEITSEKLIMKHKRTYTKRGKTSDDYDYGTLVEKEFWRKQANEGPILFLWGEENASRFLLMESWAQDLITELKGQMGGDFDDEIATSALVGFQLSAPPYQLPMNKYGKSHLKNLDAAPKIRLLKMLHATMQVAEQPTLKVAEMATSISAPGLETTMKSSNGSKNEIYDFIQIPP